MILIFVSSNQIVWTNEDDNGRVDVNNLEENLKVQLTLSDSIIFVIYIIEKFRRCFCCLCRPCSHRNRVVSVWLYLNCSLFAQCLLGTGVKIKCTFLERTYE